jgi:hypothetical protein
MELVKASFFHPLTPASGGYGVSLKLIECAKKRVVNLIRTNSSQAKNDFILINEPHRIARYKDASTRRQAFLSGQSYDCNEYSFIKMKTWVATPLPPPAGDME